MLLQQVNCSCILLPSCPAHSYISAQHHNIEFLFITILLFQLFTEPEMDNWITKIEMDENSITIM